MNFNNMKLKFFEKNFCDPYSISLIDLSEFAEQNRIRLKLVSPFICLFGVISFITTIILHYKNLQEQLVSLLYFGIYAITAFFSFIISAKLKNCPKEKAVIYKNIPLYSLFYETLLASLYNFYFLKQPFNGFIIFCLICCIVLNLFSFAPLMFLLGQILVFGFMASGLYNNFGFTGVFDAAMITIVIFFLMLYKRKTEKKSILFAKRQKSRLMAKTFGNFTLIYDNKVVKFSRTKSNELVGYLVYKNGSSVNTKELISVLWGDHADSSRYGSNLRNLIVDIKHTFCELGIHDFFIAEYNNFRINPKSLKCDYYDFLSGDQDAQNNFTGEFMSQYSWAEDATGFLEMKILK